MVYSLFTQEYKERDLGSFHFGGSVFSQREDHRNKDDLMSVASSLTIMEIDLLINQLIY